MTSCTFYFQSLCTFFLNWITLARNIAQSCLFSSYVDLQLHSHRFGASGLRKINEAHSLCRQARTAQATAERKCMTLPLAYIFLCRYAKREASSKAAIARQSGSPDERGESKSPSIRPVLAIRANSVSFSLSLLSSASPSSLSSLTRLVFNHATLEVLNFLVRC